MSNLSILFLLLLFHTIFDFGLSILCNQPAAGWWCARQQTEANQTNSSLQADSCYCLVVKNMTQQQAFTDCTTVGGFLTDIQSAEENSLINVFLNAALISNETSNVICGELGVHFNGNCYNYTAKMRKNWLDAEKYCQNTFPSGHLTSIHSLAEQRFLYSMTKNCSDCTIYGFWVGGNNHGDPTRWTWSDGTAMDYTLEVTKYKAWAPQPEDPKNQQCITIVTPDGGWGDWYCFDVSNFVCSFPPPIFPAWIGLQKTLSGHAWNLGSNCQMSSPKFGAWDELSESPSKSAYLYQSNHTWSGVVPTTTTAMAAVCRLDRNICGRNPCPSSANCSSSSGGTCYNCI